MFVLRARWNEKWSNLGKSFFWQLLEVAKYVLTYVHYCLMGVAVACMGASLGNNPFAEGELQDWVMDAIGLFVWIVIAAIAYVVGRIAYWWWISLHEDARPSRSQSKQDLFTL